MDKTQTARAPRIQITALHHVCLIQKNPPLGTPVLLANLSPSGVGILRKSLNDPPSPQQLIHGDLVFGKTSVPVSIRIVHASAAVIGGKFESPSELLQNQIKEYFDLELAALHMMKINPKFHKKEPDGETHWIHGDNAEIYYVSSGDEVIRFRMAFFGNHIEGGESIPVKGGQIIEDNDPDRIGVKGSSLIQLQEMLPKPLINAAIKLVANIPNLPPPHASAITRILNRTLTQTSK